MEEEEACPICQERMPIEVLPVHVDACMNRGTPSKPVPKASRSVPQAGPHHNDDEDFKLAMRLQAELNSGGSSPATASSSHSSSALAVTRASSSSADDEAFARSLQEESGRSSSSILCQQCKKSVKLDDLYILDECSHKFCRSCIKEYVADRIAREPTVKCPLKECQKELSVRDIKELLPQKREKTSDSRASPLAPTGGSAKAQERLLSELKTIAKSQPEKLSGFSAAPLNDNLYHWEVRMFDFDKETPLHRDLQKTKEKSILLHVTFPKNFPFAPPFIRVIRPRFQFRTGHVTIGGSICTEMLTNKGWSPANTIEATLVSIRANFITGGAALDLTNKSDYEESEAKAAFDRMVQQHGW